MNRKKIVKLPEGPEINFPEEIEIGDSIQFWHDRFEQFAYGTVTKVGRELIHINHRGVTRRVRMDAWGLKIYRDRDAFAVNIYLGEDIPKL